MPWIILTIIALILDLIQIIGYVVSLATNGLPAYHYDSSLIIGVLVIYILFFSISLYLFLVVWSYRFEDILRKTYRVINSNCVL